MANVYVKHTGSNTSPYDTWAKAATTLQTAAGFASAGDTIYVSSTHTQTQTTDINCNFAGTLASPNRVLSCNDGAAPPTALAAGAFIQMTTGAGGYGNFGGCVYFYGLTIEIDGQVICNYTSGPNNSKTFENCSLQTTNGGSFGVVELNNGSNTLGLCRYINCTFKFAHANNRAAIKGRVIMEGCSFVSGTTTPTQVFSIVGDRQACEVLISGMDFSNLAATVNLIESSQGSPCTIILREVKLPASWSGLLVSSGTIAPGAFYRMFLGDNAATNYRLWCEGYEGSTKNETTIVRTGGADDGVTPLSWAMASAANVEFPLILLESPEIAVWNDTVGSSVTATVEFVHDTNVAAGQGAGTANAFQDDEVWLEVLYISASGMPLGAFVSDCKATVIATAADQTSSSETWTTTGLTTPVKQKMSVTFTPQMAGYLIGKVKVAKASKTIYVDPVMTLT